MKSSRFAGIVCLLLLLLFFIPAVSASDEVVNAGAKLFWKLPGNEGAKSALNSGPTDWIQRAQNSLNAGDYTTAEAEFNKAAQLVDEKRDDIGDHNYFGDMYEIQSGLSQLYQKRGGPGDDLKATSAKNAADDNLKRFQIESDDNLLPIPSWIPVLAIILAITALTYRRRAL